MLGDHDVPSVDSPIYDIELCPAPWLAAFVTLNEILVVISATLGFTNRIDVACATPRAIGQRRVAQCILVKVETLFWFEILYFHDSP